jgi:hypothetical protein
VGRELQGGDKPQWHGVKHIQASWIVCGSASIVIGTNEEDMNESRVAWHAAKKIGSRPDMQSLPILGPLEVVLT